MPEDEDKLKEAVIKEQAASRDYTKERQERCAPIVKKILNMMLEQDLLMSDLHYLEDVVKRQFDALATHLVSLHAVEIFQMTKDSLEMAFKNAQESLFKIEDIDHVSVKDIDTQLRRADVEKKYQASKEGEDEESSEK